MIRKFLTGLFVCTFIISGSYCQVAGPQPGDIYKEFVLNLKIGNNWRVTDPDAGASGAHEFLPNPVMTIQIDDMDGAIRAEALMDIWGGHTGTIGKKVRFNQNNWIDIPDHPTIEESPECYNSEFNYIIDVPLTHLHEGDNEFEGTSGGQTCFNFNWGQWGWYVMLIRIYYGPGKPHPTGEITSHPSGSEIAEMDTIFVVADSPSGIKQVNLLGKYTGYDENGDGIFTDWHRNYHTPSLAEHIGSAKIPPYQFVWHNQWIPDQEPASVAIMARIVDSNNVWFVTEIADSISFVRPEGISVKMFTAENIPKKFWVRAGEKKYCTITIDDLSGATNAILKHRTWNGRDGGAGSGGIALPLIVNSWKGKVGGIDHNYYLSVVDVPLDELITGSNKIGYHSDTEHHGIEILWPGPAILVRYNEGAESVATPLISPSGGEYQMPMQVSISCETPGAEIYYTTSGPDPNVGSRKYSSPITINDTSIVKTIAIKFDYKSSEIAQQNYFPYVEPQLVEAWKGPAPNTILVRFNKPVEETSAEDILNYSLDNQGIVEEATQDDSNKKLVMLTVSGLESGEEYSLTVNNVRDYDGTAIPANSVVSFINQYEIKITASGADGSNIASNTMDGNLDTYWSANGTTGVWIQYDLGTPRWVQSVDIAFFLGDQRHSYFSIETSTDGINWTEVFNGESNGSSLGLEHFDIVDVTARYIRIMGLGNSSTTNWNSYTEVKINWLWETKMPDHRQTGFYVYPVPAVDGIHVELPFLHEEAEIYFVNAMGQKSVAPRTDKSSMISTRNLDPGMYLVLIQSGKRFLQQKILIIND